MFQCISCAVDIDECSTMNNTCSPSDTLCVNTIGGYTCNCPDSKMQDPDNDRLCVGKCMYVNFHGQHNNTCTHHLRLLT